MLASSSAAVSSAQWFPCNNLSSLWPIKLKTYTVLPYQRCLLGIAFQVQRSRSAFQVQRSRSLLLLITNWFTCNNSSSLRPIKLNPHKVFRYQNCLLGIAFQVQRSRPALQVQLSKVKVTVTINIKLVSMQ